MRKKLLPVFAAAILMGLMYFSQSAKADSGGNVSGWAWSENIGWISFNCENQGSCGTSNYGVNIDPSGKFSGYAWSENIGWISFNETTDCPSAPCQPTFNKTTGQVSGWARACAGTLNGDCTGSSRTDGWDGWIHLRGSNYGVQITGCNWDGYAWGSDVVGWIHFRGTNYGVTGSGNACQSGPPSANNLSVRQPDYCSSGPAGFFSWQFTDPDGDSQSAYQVQVYNNSNFSSLEYDSGKVNSDSQSYATPLGKLSYGNTYFWRLTVWDSKGAASSWISGPSFLTPAHAYPEINFSWAPPSPSQNEEVQFTDRSQVFGGSTKSAWSWTFQDGDPSSSTDQNPTTKFISPGSKTVTLEVTDSSDFTCKDSKTFSARLPLPEWKEIAPF